jgi:hypothetical protein
MRLPIQLLQQIIGHPVSGFSGRGQKRAMGRVAVQAFASIYPLNGDLLDDPFPVTIRDISAETVGVTSNRAMMPHASMVIGIPIKGEKDPIAVRCRVARCTRLKDGRFALAAQFQGICQLQHLLSKTKALS